VYFRYHTVIIFATVGISSLNIGSTLRKFSKQSVHHPLLRLHHKLRGGSSSTVVQLPKLQESAYACSTSDVIESLGTSMQNGLPPNEVIERVSLYGPNSLPNAPLKSIWKLVAEQFDDRLVQILLSVATLSAVAAAVEKDTHAAAEPVIIMFVLALNAFVGIWQSKSAEGALDALTNLQPSTACVLRNGQWDNSVPTPNIVPGDVIRLRVGDKVPADARVVQLVTNTFSTDEASLTGESVTVAKHHEALPSSDCPIAAQSNMVNVSIIMVFVFASCFVECNPSS
jgi:P-type Ca2+ transporter type 2C